MELNLNVIYPGNDKKYETILQRLDWDKEFKKDFDAGLGFYITKPDKVLTKTLKNPNSIFSAIFTKTAQDPEAYSDRYSCPCKKTQGRDHKDEVCPFCHQKVVFVGEDLNITGWIDLKNYHIIHPNMYLTLSSYFGKATLEEILIPEIELDENGNPVSQVDKRIDTKAKTKSRRGPKKANVDETYAHIGMIEFYNRFDEILEYFHGKNKTKKLDVYEDIIKNRELIFPTKIPVFTTALRPYKLEGGRLTFESTNSIFMMLATQGADISDDSKSMKRNPRYKNLVAWDLQDKLNRLTQEIIKILKTKKGQIRSLLAGRCCFISRSVIRPDPTLQIDQVRLPYYSLLELMQQTIINILVRTYNIGESEAYMRFSKAKRVPDKYIISIIQNIIDTIGITVLVNRNPTISFGSIMAMRVAGINMSYTMSMPLQALAPFNAD